MFNYFDLYGTYLQNVFKYRIRDFHPDGWNKRKGRWIFQFIFTIAMGFPLGIHFGNLLDLSPIGIGFLAGGISLLAHIITTANVASAKIKRAFVCGF